MGIIVQEYQNDGQFLLTKYTVLIPVAVLHLTEQVIFLQFVHLIRICLILLISQLNHPPRLICDFQ